MSRQTSHPFLLLLAFALALGSACSEPECPAGFIKIGNICHHMDAGQAQSDSAVQADDDHDAGRSTDDAGQASDAGGSTPASGDSGTGALNEAGSVEAGSTASGPDAAADAATSSDAATSTGADAGDGSTVPLPECDNTRPCTAGYVCSGMKCVSACTQTQCDPNATCSLVANDPVCACNGGFIAVTTSSTTSCVRDVACEELGCDVNAGCQVGTDQVRHCVCKNGYTGSGKTCTPVSCPTPTLANGITSTPDGITFGKTATYQCNAGFKQLVGGSWTRTCGAEMQWSGTTPSCTVVTCPALTNPANGTVSTPLGQEFGDTASYACAAGFKPSGDSTRTCQADGSWSGSASTCVAACGDGVVDKNLGEACDPKASSIWSCDPLTCQPTTIYAACTGNNGEQGNGCDPGQSCYPSFCTISCKNGADCPSTPSGSRPSGVCSPSGGICIAQGCISNSDCAPGLVCYHASNGVNSCSACNDSNALCTPPLQCVIVSGGTGSAFRLCR